MRVTPIAQTVTNARGRPMRPAVPAVPVQAKTSEQDVDGVHRMACSKCQITYYSVVGHKAQCPLCDAERRIVEIQAVLHSMRSELEDLSNRSTVMAASLDVITAMKSALDLVSQEDMVFLKSILYRYREDHTAFSLRVTYGGGGKGAKPEINGYMMMPKRGDPEAHACNSIGGAAIASYYEEICRSNGQVTALNTLMRALSGILAPGG